MNAFDSSALEFSQHFRRRGTIAKMLAHVFHKISVLLNFVFFVFITITVVVVVVAQLHRFLFVFIRFRFSIKSCCSAVATTGFLFLCRRIKLLLV